MLWKPDQPRRLHVRPEAPSQHTTNPEETLLKPHAAGEAPGTESENTVPEAVKQVILEGDTAARSSAVNLKTRVGLFMG